MVFDCHRYGVYYQLLRFRKHCKWSLLFQYVVWFYISNVLVCFYIMGLCLQNVQFINSRLLVLKGLHSLSVLCCNNGSNVLINSADDKKKHCPCYGCFFCLNF
ncbi:unnamed protein product, partial [Brassica napus]